MQMRFLSIAILSCAAVLNAQSPLTTTFVNNNGNAAGGMVFFDLDVTDPAGIQIYALDINTAGASGGIDFYTVPTTHVGNEANAAAWTLAGGGTYATGAGMGMPTQICMGTGFYLPQGQYGVALAQDPTATNQAYTNGIVGTNLIYTTAELTLTAGASNNTQFAGAAFSPRVWNGSIFYNLGPVPGVCVAGADKEQYGLGCNRSYASIYEISDTASFDLTNTDLTATNTGAGYVILATPGTGPLPVGGIDPLGGTVLTLPDDGQVVAGTLGMSVGSNGWMAAGAGNSNGFSPTGAIMIGNPSEGVYTWTDLQPNTSGTTTYEEDVATGQCRVTFDGVVGWNTPDPCFIQIDMNVNTGDWAIRYGTVGFANPEDWLVGYSPAGANADPGSTDISAAPGGVLITEAVDIVPLTIDSNNPSLGGNWDVTTSSIDPLSPIAITFFGTRGPATPATLIGIPAPGCDINLATAITSITAPNAGGSTMVQVPIPNIVALAGYQLSAQSICLTASNAANLLFSNGVEGTLGQ
jgi:hypothetical protein